MEELRLCPSTLKEGFRTCSPEACRKLFGGKQVSHILDIDSPDNENSRFAEYATHIGRISLSGVQPKGSLVLKDGKLSKPDEGERGLYILSTYQHINISTYQRINIKHKASSCIIHPA